MNRLWCLCFIFLVSSFGYSNGARSKGETVSSQDEVHKTTFQLVKLRGFKAVNHFFTTSDGYILNLVQVTNPLINNGTSGLRTKDVVYFIHGTESNANFFIVNSVGAHPIDYSHIDVTSKSVDELREFFKHDPNRNAFPYLLANLGHEVWLLNRRGTYQSQGHIGEYNQPFLNPITNIKETLFGGLHKPKAEPLADHNPTNSLRSILRRKHPKIIKSATDLLTLGNTFNPRYWNYTFDQQIYFDLPETIDYILSITGRKNLAVVAHSNGGLITLSALSAIPEINQKISTPILLGPALYPRAVRNYFLFAAHYPLLRSYIGPILPKMILPPIHHVLATGCTSTLRQDTVCRSYNDVVFGYGGQQQVLIPGTVNALYDTYGSQQILHYAQSIIKKKTYHFDYGSKRQNLIAYNQTEPPLYDVSKITNPRLTFWIGKQDGQIPPEAVEAVIADLAVKPLKVVHIGGNGVFFNHVSFSLHEDVGNLLYIPALKTLANP